MSQRQIVITVNRDGSSVVDAQGFKGKGCVDATKGIELALAGGGSENKDSRKKPDFYQSHTSAGTVKR